MVFPVDVVTPLAPAAPLLALAHQDAYVPESQGWAGVPSRIRRPENSEEHFPTPFPLGKNGFSHVIFACLWDQKMKSPTPCIMSVGPS